LNPPVHFITQTQKIAKKVINKYTMVPFVTSGGVVPPAMIIDQRKMKTEMESNEQNPKHQNTIPKKRGRSRVKKFLLVLFFS
jgi:hypothetical protein